MVGMKNWPKWAADSGEWREGGGMETEREDDEQHVAL